MVGRFLKRLVNPETDQAADRPAAQESAPGDRSPVAEDTGDDHAVRLAANEEGLLQAVDAPAALSEDESREEEEVARPDTGPEPEPETEPGQMLESDAEDDLPEAEAEPETELAPEPEPEPEQVPESEVEEQVAPGQQPEPEDDLPEGEAEPEPQPELESESELESEPEPESEKPEPPTARQSPTDEFSMAQSAVSSGFIITLAHELRTPIASLRVSYDLLKHPDTLKDNPSQSKRLLGNIDRSIARLERQASDLLEVGYLRAGSMSLLKQPLDLTEPMLAAIDISRPAAALRHVAIELEIQPDQPSVVADGYRLTQVMTHLLSNAIKFEPVQGSVLVTLGTGSSATPSSAENLPNNEESAPDVVIARVVDHGPGIRESHFELIFEPFYRISDEGIEGGAGVGLGLAIVKGLIDLHEGTVWVKSTPGEVTEFGFSIPIA